MNLSENLWIFLSYLKLLIILLPIFIFGIIILKKISEGLKLTLLMPAGIILGFTIFTFLVNLSFNVLPAKLGIWSSYLLIVILNIGLIFTTSWKLPELNKKEFTLWVLGFGFWLGLVSWKANFALIGGDIRSYYAIAGSSIQGNFPSVTPWQPDVELAYHTGAFVLLGALNYLAGISFLPLHLILSVIFIVSSVQILVWIISEKFSVLKFIIANLAALIGFVSFGFLKLIYPVFPLKFPEINNINQLVIWLRNLPSARESIELYGASYNLDSLIYILFQNYGLSILFCITVILLNLKKSLYNLIIILICLAVLALVNESIFVPAVIPIFLLTTYSYSKQVLSRKFLYVTLSFIVAGIIILFQGGLITANLLSNDKTPPSIEIFPRSSSTQDYLLNSQKSRILTINGNWLPFGWVNVGIEFQLIVVFALLYFSKHEKRLRNYCLLLFGFSIGAILTYNLIIPKYVTSNSNRILVPAYQLLSMIITVLTISWLLKLKSQIIKWSGVVVFGFTVLIPTILPPLSWMSTTRFGQNKLIPIEVKKTETEKWLEKNVEAQDRFAVLDVNSPHPSGAASLMALAGIKAPLFTGGFKTYTIEPGPEYTDITYSLNPESLNKLKINKLIIDDKFYHTLPEIRKTQLQNENFFKLLFEENNSEGWKRIYQIQSEYFLKSKNLEGSFDDLNRSAPKQGKYFADSQNNFYIDYIRRPLIFTLRDRDLYFEAESGVYQHTETPVNIKAPVNGMDYDYLVLSDKTNPEMICNCKPMLIWKYLNGKILLWKTN